MDQLDSSVLDYLSGKISFEEWVNQRDTTEVLEKLITGQHEQDGGERQGGVNDAAEGEGQSMSKLSRSTGQEHVQLPVGHVASYSEWLASDSLEPPEANNTQTNPTEQLAFDAELSFTLLAYPGYSLPQLNEDADKGQLEECKVLHNVASKLSPLLAKDERGLGHKFKRADIDELTEDILEKPKKKRGKKKGSLPYILRLQMGEANMLIANKEFDKAIPICMEIIRQVPNNPTPFKALGFIYEERGDQDKAIQYFLIAAFLGCHDPSEWVELAHRCSQAGLKRQEVECYNQACKSAPTNIPILWSRATLYLEHQEHKKALEGYNCILKIIPQSKKSVFIEVARDIAKVYHSIGAFDKAIDVLESALMGCKEQVDPEGLNMLMEILITQKDFKRALEAASQYGKIETSKHIADAPYCMQAEDKTTDLEALPKTPILPDGDQTEPADTKDLGRVKQESILDSASLELTRDVLMPTRETCAPENTTRNENIPSLDEVNNLQDTAQEIKETLSYPENLPIDIRVKVAVCCIQESRDVDLKDLLSPLFDVDVEDVADLYLDLGEAYIEKGKHENAIIYLDPITKTDSYGQAGVWLKLATSLQAVGQLERAVEAYQKVLELAPQQMGVTLQLFYLLRELNREEEAIELLSEPLMENLAARQVQPEAESSSEVMPIEKKDLKHWYKKCTLLYGIGNTVELANTGFILFQNYFKLPDLVKEIQKGAMFELFRKVLSACVECKYFKAFDELLDRANRYRHYAEAPTYKIELEYFATSGAILKGDFESAFDVIRGVATRDSEAAFNTVGYWNLYSYIVNRVDNKRHHRYISRLLTKRNTLLPLIIQNAHNSFVCGTYKHAVGEYVRAFRIQPSDPVLSLLIGIAFLHHACQKFVKQRNTIIFQGLIFVLHYFYLRGQTQEAYYNLGRAFHQVGLAHFAVHFYNRALGFPVQEHHDDDDGSEISNFTYLHREAAFNLSRIYLASGNAELANDILWRYCWV